MDAIIIGRRRQGKTTLALRIARRCPQPCLIVFDPNDDAAFRSFPHYPPACLAEILQMAAEDGTAIEVAVTCGADPNEAFQELVEVLRPYGNYVLLVDESNSIQSAHQINPGLAWIVRKSPRDGAQNGDGDTIDVSIIQTTHRWVDVHTVSRSLASDTFMFRTTLARDLEAIEKEFGRDVAAHVAQLQQFQCVHWWIGKDGRERYSIWRSSEQPADADDSRPSESTDAGALVGATA